MFHPLMGSDADFEGFGDLPLVRDVVRKRLDVYQQFTEAALERFFDWKVCSL